MLKQYRCKKCNLVHALDSEEMKEEPVGCLAYDSFEQMPCKGRLIEFQVSEFPANLEIVSLIAELTTKLTFKSAELVSLQTKKEAVDQTLKQMTKKLQSLLFQNSELVEENKNLTVQMDTKGEEGEVKKIEVPSDLAKARLEPVARPARTTRTKKAASRGGKRVSKVRKTKKP